MDLLHLFIVLYCSIKLDEGIRQSQAHAVAAAEKEHEKNEEAEFGAWWDRAYERERLRQAALEEEELRKKKHRYETFRKHFSPEGVLPTTNHIESADQEVERLQTTFGKRLISCSLENIIPETYSCPLNSGGFPTLDYSSRDTATPITASALSKIDGMRAATTAGFKGIGGKSSLSSVDDGGGQRAASVSASVSARRDQMATVGNRRPRTVAAAPSQGHPGKTFEEARVGASIGPPTTIPASHMAVGVTMGHPDTALSALALSLLHLLSPTCGTSVCSPFFKRVICPSLTGLLLLGSACNVLLRIGDILRASIYSSYEVGEYGVPTNMAYPAGTSGAEGGIYCHAATPKDSTSAVGGVTEGSGENAKVPPLTPPPALFVGCDLDYIIFV